MGKLQISVYRRQDLVKSLIFIFALTFYIIIVDIRHKCNVFYFELKRDSFHTLILAQTH